MNNIISKQFVTVSTMSSGFLLMSIIGFFIPIDVDGHVLNKTNLNNQTELRYYKNKDLLYILSALSITYLFIVIMVILLYVTNYIIHIIFMYINKNKKEIQNKDKNSYAQLNIYCQSLQTFYMEALFVKFYISEVLFKRLTVYQKPLTWKVV